MNNETLALNFETGNLKIKIRENKLRETILGLWQGHHFSISLYSANIVELDFKTYLRLS